MEATNEHEKQNSTPHSSDNSDGLIPFTEAQLSTLSARQAQYFTEARNKLNYDLELAAQLDDRLKEAIRSGKRVQVSLERAGFVCE